MMNRLTSSTAILLMLACNAPGDAVPAKPEPFKPTLIIRPLAVSLARGATQAFHAEINYQEGMRYIRQPVTWSVVEPGGGTITGTGLYTAPTEPGTYQVQAKREDFPEVVATAKVVVK